MSDYDIFRIAEQVNRELKIIPENRQAVFSNLSARGQSCLFKGFLRYSSDILLND